MEVYVLFDEELGECKVFLSIADAKSYYEEEDTGKWKKPKGDNGLWVSAKGYFYIFRREIIG